MLIGLMPRPRLVPPLARTQRRCNSRCNSLCVHLAEVTVAESPAIRQRLAESLSFSKDSPFERPRRSPQQDTATARLQSICFSLSLPRHSTSGTMPATTTHSA